MTRTRNEDVNYDDLAFDHGYEFIEVGDEWALAPRFEAITPESGYPTKQEAWEVMAPLYGIVEDE